MICKRCGKKNAEVYYKQTVNGQTSEYALCSECAEELKKQGKLNIKIPSLFDEYDLGFGSGGLFGMTDLLGLMYDTQKPKITEKKRCTLCSSTLDEMAATGKVGCAKCYEVFADELKRSVESIHGKAKYMGKRPKRIKERDTKEDKLKALKNEMKAAVKAEEFERAAQLRDEIRNLENGN